MEERAQRRARAPRGTPPTQGGVRRGPGRAAVVLLLAAGAIGTLASCGAGDAPAGAPPAGRPDAVPPPADDPAASADGAASVTPPNPSPEGRAARPDPDAADASAPDDPPLPASPAELADLLLRDELRGERRDEARDALAEHGDAAVPAFIRLLASESHASWACVRLQELGPAAAPAAKALARVVETNVDARGAAAWALVCIGQDGALATAPLLRSDDADVRTTALDTLGRVGGVPTEIEKALIDATRDEDVAVRGMAAYALRSVATDRTAATGALFALLADENGHVRDAALGTMQRAAHFADEIRPRAAELVRYAERFPDDAWHVGNVLSELGAAPMLSGLASESPDVRATMAQYADPRDTAVLARLVELLDDPSPDVAGSAFRRIARLDDPPPEAAKVAVAILAAPRRASRDAHAGEMMAEIDERRAAVRVVAAQIRRGERPADALVPSLEDPWTDVRGAAAIALADSVRPADLDRVLAAVRSLWQDESLTLDVRVRLAGAVGAREGRGSATVPWLSRIADSGGGGRTEAITELGGIDDPAAASTILGQLDVVILEVRTAAVAALAGHVSRDPRVVPALVGELRTAKRAEVRAAAATSLAAERGRPEVREALVAAKRDRWEIVRDAAKAALGE